MRCDAREYGRARRSGRATSVRVAPTGTAVEQYQVPLGNRYSLREAGVIGLPSWSEKATQTETWVKVPRLSTTCPRRVVAFDGGRSIAGASLFLFFDDFPGAAIDSEKWTSSGDGVTVSNSVVSVTTPSTSPQYIDSKYAPPENSVVRWKVKNYHADNSAMAGSHTEYIYLGKTNFSQFFVCFLSHKDSPNFGRKHAYFPGSVYVALADVNSGTLTGQWRIVEMVHAPDRYKATVDGVTDYNATKYKSRGWTSLFRILAQYAGSKIDADWVVVRKYVANEPLAGTAAPTATNRALCRPMSHADLMRAVCA